MRFVLERGIPQLKGKKPKERRKILKAAHKANLAIQIWLGVVGGIAGGFVVTWLVMSEVLFGAPPVQNLSFVAILLTTICLIVSMAITLFLFAGFVINPLVKDTLEKMSTEQIAGVNHQARVSPTSIDRL